MKRVSKLYFDSTGITNLPTSIGNLTSHASLSVRDCKNLMPLPSTFFFFFGEEILSVLLRNALQINLEYISGETSSIQTNI